MEQCERCGGLLLMDHVCNESEAELMTAMKEHLLKSKTIWIVEYHIPYDGDSICAAFSTEEKAVAYINKHNPNWASVERGDKNGRRSADSRHGGYGYYYMIVDGDE